MPRYYAKNDKPLDFYKILGAIKAVKVRSVTIRRAATEFEIPRSNLKRYLTKFANVDVSMANEDLMINLLTQFSKRGVRTVSFFKLSFINYLKTLFFFRFLSQNRKRS